MLRVAFHPCHLEELRQPKLFIKQAWFAITRNNHFKPLLMRRKKKPRQFVHECSLCSDRLHNLECDVTVAVSNRADGNISGSKTNSLVSMASHQSLNQQMTDCSGSTCKLFIALQQHPHESIPGQKHSLLTNRMCCFWLRTTVFLWLLLILPVGPISAKSIRQLRETTEVMHSGGWMLMPCHIPTHNKNPMFHHLLFTFKDYTNNQQSEIHFHKQTDWISWIWWCTLTSYIVHPVLWVGVYLSIDLDCCIDSQINDSFDTTWKHWSISSSLR